MIIKHGRKVKGIYSISQVAEECGVSINQFIIETLAEAVENNMKMINMNKEKTRQQEENL